MVTRREAELAAACRAVARNWNDGGDLAASARMCAAALKIKSKPTRRRVAVEIKGGALSVRWQDKGTALTVRDVDKGEERVYTTSLRHKDKRRELLTDGTYRCNNCEQLFEEPAPVGNGLGVASPCCDSHFTEEGDEMEGTRICSRECCP